MICYLFVWVCCVLLFAFCCSDLKVFTLYFILKCFLFGFWFKSLTFAFWVKVVYYLWFVLFVDLIYAWLWGLDLMVYVYVGFVRGVYVVQFLLNLRLLFIDFLFTLDDSCRFDWLFYLIDLVGFMCYCFRFVFNLDLYVILWLGLLFCSYVCVFFIVCFVWVFCVLFGRLFYVLGINVFVYEFCSYLFTF